MIELCTKRKMIISIIVLGFVTILILILEEALTEKEVNSTYTTAHNDFIIKRPNGISLANINNNNNSQKNVSLVLDKSHQKINQNKATADAHEKPLQNINLDLDPCSLLENCSKCTEFEIKSKTPEVCIHGEMKETYLCEKKGRVYKSCINKDSLKARFWIFESFMLLLAVIATGIVKMRTSQLGRRAAKKIERQLANG